ncbi:MAG: hypothetical protein R3C32_08940 [Chloroflexota bacterium]
MLGRGGGWLAPDIGSAVPPDQAAAALAVGETIGALVGTDGRIHQWGETGSLGGMGFGEPGRRPVRDPPPCSPTVGDG